MKEGGGVSGRERSGAKGGDRRGEKMLGREDGGDRVNMRGFGRCKREKVGQGEGE